MREYEETRAFAIAGISLATVLNAMPWAKRQGGGAFQPRDFFPQIPRAEQTPEEMLAIMKANSAILNGKTPEA